MPIPRQLQERIYVELGREPLLAGGFGQETEQVFAEFKERLHAVMWLNDRRNHKAKTHHELHLLLLEFVQKTLDVNTSGTLAGTGSCASPRPCLPPAAPPPPPICRHEDH